MSNERLAVAAAKVIAAGSAGSDALRATLILTPPATGGNDLLAAWPGTVIKWLRQNQWRLTLYAEPVTCSNGECSLPAKDKRAYNVVAKATAMADVWSGQANIEWVNALWSEAFATKSHSVRDSAASTLNAIGENSTPPWSGLAEALKVATSATDTLPPTPSHSKDKSRNKIETSKQTELALVLERNRALELCDSVREAYAASRKERVELRLKEIDYLPGRFRENGKRIDEAALIARLTDGARPFNNGPSSFLVPPAYAQDPPSPSPAVQPKKALPRRETLKHAMDELLPFYQAANRPENNPAEGASAPDNPPLRTFYALQSSPTLARLLGLAIDLHVPVQSVQTSLGANHFLYLSIDESVFHRDPESPSIFTMARYQPGTPSHFWPATREEIAVGSTPNPASILSLRQYQSVSVCLQQRNDGSDQRFELSSLDGRRAVEATIDRQTIIAEQLGTQSDSGLKTLIMSGDQLYKLTTDSPLRPAAFARKTYHTAGFSLLDRSRRAQAMDQYSKRNEQKNQLSERQLRLDASDLLTGYRIDVAVPCRPGEPCQLTSYAWRGLMARKITYGVTGLYAKQIQTFAPRLFLEDASNQPFSLDSGWQKCLEDGYVGLTARKVTSRDDSTNFDAHVDEAIAVWNGDPMGVHILGKREDKVQADDLPCGRVIVAPNATTEPSRRIPLLRFGLRYRFGLRAVYPGGISLPLRAAVALYDDPKHGAALSIPAMPQSGPQGRARRYLRHERIDAPLLLLPEEAALRRNGPMGYESAARAIVRSVNGSVHDRQQPSVAQRIFVAPGVSQYFASMHGVFDHLRIAWPDEGLSSFRFGPNGVRRDPVHGGFPVVTSDHIVGINGLPYPTSRRTSTNTTGEGADSGDLVYSTSPHAQAQRYRKEYVPYYPDPAIKSFVIGVRVAGSDTYLEGTCVIDATGKGYDYPYTRPLVLTVQRCPGRSSKSGVSALPRLDEVVTPPAPNGRLPHLPDDARRFPGVVEVLISLVPGDDFEVDVWCIPDEAGLARHFAIVETIAALANVASQGINGFMTGLQQMMPARFCDEVSDFLKTDALRGNVSANNEEGSVGPGGLSIPGPRIILAAASALVKTLRCRPLDELASVRTLRATHATDRPLAEPRLRAAESSGEVLRLALLQTDRSPRKEYPPAQQGSIEFDWGTTSSLEITADMASPSSDKMDDVERGRAILDRRLGKWPHQDGSPMDPGRVFGFDVSATGEVTLPKTSGVTLFRLDDIPLLSPEGVSRSGSLASIPLDVTAANFGTGKSTFQFTDGLARQLDLRVTAYSRHRDQMRTAGPLAHDGKWLREGKPLTADESSRQSACVPVWLNATVRPAEPAAQTPIPAFFWSDEKPLQQTCKTSKKQRSVRRTRSMIVRIPIARRWLSSGEGEQLGIVLWPPDILAQKPEKFAEDEIWFHQRKMKLTDFLDEDLGPGGKFITRWGGDPTRFPVEGLREYGKVKEANASAVSSAPTLVPASAFLDLCASGTGFVPELHSRVIMPIRAEQNTAKPEDEKSRDITTLEVALLAYRPKFDIAEEQWYVDVALEHPREAEPFVRLGLVRFQPHAPEHLQVSYPVVQWTQLLPRRSVEVRRCGSDVTIRVEGLATSPRESLLKTIEANELFSNDNKERLPRTRMTVRIIREGTLPIGVATRDVVVQSDFEEENITYNQLSEGSYNAIWEQTLTLDNMDAQHAKYFAIVEERDLRLPATYANEPVSPERAIGNDCKGEIDKSLLVLSGLRFSAKIAI